MSKIALLNDALDLIVGVYLSLVTKGRNVWISNNN
jgi:hypothetical protein